jgi:hypothetical protein
VISVWIVWHDDYDATYPYSIHDTEAGASAEAQRIAEELWSADKARHEASERARVANAGAWRWTYPEQLAPEWVPGRAEPAPFTRPVSDYIPRIEAFPLVSDRATVSAE